MDQNAKIKDKINSRVGNLMRQQRLLQSHSIRAVATKLKIEEPKIESWENGESSPPCHVFYKIVSFYGENAVRAAWELDFQLQKEKYHRLIRGRDGEKSSQSLAA